MTNSKAAHTAGPFFWRKFFGEPEDNEFRASLGLPPVRALTNEGQIAIMAGEGEDVKRIALIECQTKYKRGEGSRSACAERDANANLFATSGLMLAVLRFVASDPCFSKLGSVTQDEVRSAISKATGAA